MKKLLNSNKKGFKQVVFQVNIVGLKGCRRLKLRQPLHRSQPTVLNGNTNKAFYLKYYVIIVLL